MTTQAKRSKKTNKQTIRCSGGAQTWPEITVAGAAACRFGPFRGREPRESKVEGQ